MKLMAVKILLIYQFIFRFIHVYFLEKSPPSALGFLNIKKFRNAKPRYNKKRSCTHNSDVKRVIRPISS